MMCVVKAYSRFSSMRKLPSTIKIADLIKSIKESIESTLKQEGRKRAMAKWSLLNDMFSCEAWWHLAAKEIRAFLDGCADKEHKERREAEQEKNKAQAAPKVNIVNTNFDRFDNSSGTYNDNTNSTIQTQSVAPVKEPDKNMLLNYYNNVDD